MCSSDLGGCAGTLLLSVTMGAVQSSAPETQPSLRTELSGETKKIIETFEAGSTPRHRASAPIAVRIDTS